VKKSVSTLVTLACLTALTAPALGQTAAAKPTQLQPAIIGLVDMAKVFKEYKKFTDLREVLQAEMQLKQAEGQTIAKQANKLKEELKLLQPGSAEYIKRESELVRLSSEFEAKGKLIQVHYRRREAEVFESVYVDAIKVVDLYAKHFGYTMIIRFNSEPLNGNNPQALASGLNKLIVYSRPQDDITDAVSDYLNRQYKPAARSDAPRTATQQTGGTRPAN
jgi:Skp family chaperone for outer membrane proteins